MPDQPDDKNKPNPPEETPSNSDSAASTIFVELMRQAAARRTEQAPAQRTPQSMPELIYPYDEEVLKPRSPEKERPRPAPVRPNPPAAAASPSAPAPAPTAPAPDQPSAAPDPAPAPEIPDYLREPDPDEAAAALEEEAAPLDPHEQALAQQRVQRVKRQQQRRQRRRAGFFGGFARTFFLILIAAGLSSTIFTWFTEPDFLQARVVRGLQAVTTPTTPTPAPTGPPTPNYFQRIGIVSGHRGPENDPGAVCRDGLTEADINFNVAQRVVRGLRGLGFSVDLLDEFDPRLDNYQAAALVSIHANTCEDFGELVSGFLVAKADVRPEGGPDARLAECIGFTYGQATQLERRFSLTRDMTDYHSFREIHPLTPAAIIELGFMKDDRELLTEQPDMLAQAIIEGVLCFLQPGLVPMPTPTAESEQGA